MAVDLAEYESEVPDDAADTSRRIDRSTAQALLAALAALAVTTLVLTATSNALVRPGAGDTLGAEAVPVTVEAGETEPVSVDLRGIAQGRPVSQCVRIDDSGDLVPVDLELSAQLGGDGADVVDVAVARGSADDDACDDFRVDDIVFEGRLSELAGDAAPVGRIGNEQESSTFRLTFDLVDEADADAWSGSVDLVWGASHSSNAG